VLVFQHGVGKGLLGVSSANGIEAVVPLLLFVILFGLSMDYHVFIISRIRETFDRGANMDDAVSHCASTRAGRPRADRCRRPRSGRRSVAREQRTVSFGRVPSTECDGSLS